MGLKLAGIISGFGNGMGRGLEQMQAGIIQQGLMSQRFAHDDAAVAGERDYQTRKLEEQRTWEMKVKQGDQTFTGGENQKNRDAQSALHVGDREAADVRADRGIASQHLLHKEDRTAAAAETDKKIKFEGGEKDKDRALKREELAEQKEYHKGLNARMAAAKPHLPPEKQAKWDMLKERSKEAQRNIEKFADMGSKAMDDLKAEEYNSKAESAMEEQKQIHQAMEELVGVSVPRAQSEEVEIKDRFGKSPIIKGK